VDEHDERPELPRDRLDHAAEVLRLLLRQAGRRLVEQDDARAPDDRPGHLDQATLARAEPADPGPGRRLEADEVDRRLDLCPLAPALDARVLVDHRDVVEHRELLDRLFRLERPAQAPAGALVVGHPEQVLAEGADRPRSRLDEPGEDVEERRLARSVGADQAAGATREGDAHTVDRGDAREADGEVLDLDHAAPRPTTLPRPRRISRARFAMSFGNCWASPPGAVRSTWSRPAPKRISTKFGLIPHCTWKRNGRSWLKHPATTAPQRLKMPPMSVVARSVRESCVWNDCAVGWPT